MIDAQAHIRKADTPDRPWLRNRGAQLAQGT
jgi:hypothetical protein